MGEFARVYFLNSTLILYLSSFLYLTMIFVWEVQSVSILFSLMYCCELFLRYIYPDSIYWSAYFGYPFLAIDILAGPIALGFTIDNWARSTKGIHMGCVLIMSKVLTCRYNIKIMKELYYVFKATLKYFRLSLSLALCFIVTSYYLFQPYSKYFENLGETFYSMYQLCTFDNWINESAKDIRKNSSSYWLIFFAMYFIVIMLCYLIAIMSFFIIYYSEESLQQNFEFKEENFITVKDLAERLKFERKNNRSYVAKAEVIIIYFTIVALIEWIWVDAMRYRPVFLVVALLASIWYLWYRVTWYGWFKNLSHYLLFFRGVVCPALFMLSVILPFNMKYVVGILLFSCVFDLIRHNVLLRTVLKRYYKNIIQYIIILSVLCYFFSVLLFRRKSLKNFNTKTQSFLDLFLLNVQIIGFDSWGEKAHAIIEQKIYWVWCIVIMMFLGAMTVSNMFLGEIVVQMSPYIKQILTIQKLYHTKLQYQTLEDFENLCKREYINQLNRNTPR